MEGYIIDGSVAAEGWRRGAVHGAEPAAPQQP